MRANWFLLCLSCVAPAAAAGQVPDTGITAFNAALADATRQMNNAATMALWDDDGVSLLPNTPPITGKQAIAKFMEDVTARLAGARMESFDLACSDIQVSGPWASEWCAEHQVVAFPAGRPPFNGWGKMLLVLHRGTDGTWRIREEMWNEGVEPASAGR